MPGFGLIGMRERVTALGGRLSAEPGETRGSRCSPSCRRRPVTPGDRCGDPAVIRVVLVDDQALIRSGIRALLDAEDDISVVAEAANGREAVDLAVEHLPDIVLMDVQMPEMDGIEATRRIVNDDRLTDVHVVMLTNYGLDEYVFNALRAGASGFVVKDTEPADLLQALRVTMRGDALLSPGVTRRLISEFVARPADVLPAADLDRSPTGSGRSSPSWPTASATTRSPSGWCSAR